MHAAKKALQAINVQIIEQGKREVDLVEKLKELNFDRADIDALFKTENPTSQGPTEGDTQVIDGVTFVFKNGKWEPLVTFKPKADPDAAKKRKDQLKAEADELLKLQRETEDQRLALIKDSFDKEMAQNDVNHLRKMEDLAAKIEENQKLADEALVKGDTGLASKYIDQNKELYAQMELAEIQHQDNRNDILKTGIESYIKQLEAQFNQEEVLRQIAHNNELAALGDNEEAKKLLEETFNKEKLERQKLNQEELIKELQKIISTAKFEEFDLELLSEEQKQVIIDRLKELGLSLSEINKLLASMQGSKSADPLGLGNTDDVDILGFTQEQWNQMFSNSETFAQSLGKIGFMLQAATQAYSIYDSFLRASEERKLRRIDSNLEKEKTKQAQLLEKKYISQKQHDDAVKALEAEAKKRKAEIEYKQAKREKAMNIASILGNQAVAVSKALAQGGFILGIPWAGIVAGLAGLQLALAVAQPLPAKGYEGGYYGNTMQVRREQDGKLCNAGVGGRSRSGIVDKPTVFLAGEGGKNFPEMIIDGRTLKQFDPELKNSLYRELSRVRGFENGYYKTSENTGSGNNPEMLFVLSKAVDVLERLESNGVIAYISKDMANIKKLSDELDRLNRIKNKSIITK